MNSLALFLRCAPSCFGSFCRYLGALCLAQGGGAGHSPLESSEPAKGNGSRILGSFRWWLVLRSLARGFQHDLIGELIGISRARIFVL